MQNFLRFEGSAPLMFPGQDGVRSSGDLIAANAGGYPDLLDSDVPESYLSPAINAAEAFQNVVELSVRRVVRFGDESEGRAPRYKK